MSYLAELVAFCISAPRAIDVHMKETREAAADERMQPLGIYGTKCTVDFVDM